jgi:hypothetical protein
MIKHLLWLTFLYSNMAFGQTVVIDQNPSTSASAVIGQSAYHVSEAIYTNSEIGDNFLSSGTPINRVSFFITQLSSVTNIASFRIWMKNVSSATTTFSSGAYNTSGYTLVFENAININATGWKTINLNNSFIRTSGSNLMILIERFDGVAHGAIPGNTNGFVAATSNGNSNSPSVLSYRRYNGASMPTASTSLSVTAFRPAIRFEYQSPLSLQLLQPIFPEPTCKSNGNTIGWWVLNTGIDTMRSGEWSASIRINGSNVAQDSSIQFQSIFPGDSLPIFFPAIILPNAGSNSVSFMLNWTGNSTTKQDTFVRAPLLNSFPIVTGFESGNIVFSYRKTITGSRNLWVEQSGSYTNPDQAIALSPRTPGSRYMLFDAYSGASSSGFISRIFSPCIDLDRWGPSTNRNAQLRFWMSHDPLFELSMDSLFVVVTTDQGVSWQRIAGFSRVNPFLTEPAWALDSVDLTAYWGQTIQIGFEGKSQFGNAFGLDDVEINVSPNCLQAPTVFAGNDTAICSGNGYLLVGGLPTFNGPVSTVFWRTSGTGSFDGGTLFNQATSYIPSAHDLAEGSIQLQLIASAADGLQCPSDTAEFELQFIQSDEVDQIISSCTPISWQGNLISESGTYVWSGTNVQGCDSVIRLHFNRFDSDSTFLRVSTCAPFSFNGGLLHTSGRYVQTLVNQNGCDSILVLDYTRFLNTNSYDTIYACSPFVWNGNTITQSGSYSVITPNANGCDSIQSLVVFMENCSTRIAFKLMLEGMYRGNGQQSALLYDLGLSPDSEASDTISLTCWDLSGSPHYRAKSVVDQNGWVDIGIPSIHQGKLLYLSLEHRNSITIWAAVPVLLSGVDSIDLVDTRGWVFEDGFNDPLSVLFDGTRAMYGGDLNQDGTVDIFDAQLAENDAAVFGYGYVLGDLNGDGTTDIFDLQLIENNGSRFIFAARPF